MLHEFEGIFDLTPFGVKNLEKISDFTVNATKLSIRIHPNMVLDEFEGILDLIPFWVKNLEKNCDFTVDAVFLLGFLVDRYQTMYVHSCKHRVR